MLEKLAVYDVNSFPSFYPPRDSAADPRLHNGTWGPWKEWIYFLKIVLLYLTRRNPSLKTKPNHWPRQAVGDSNDVLDFR